MADRRKKERSSNFAPCEISILIDLILKYKTIVENKKTDSVMWKEKEVAWTKITEEFNALSITCPRSTKCLKTKFECMKKEVRKKKALQQQELYKTGGGITTSIVLTPPEEKILSIILINVEGLPSKYDSDESKYDNIKNT